MIARVLLCMFGGLIMAAAIGAAGPVVCPPGPEPHPALPHSPDPYRFPEGEEPASALPADRIYLWLRSVPGKEEVPAGDLPFADLSLSNGKDTLHFLETDVASAGDRKVGVGDLWTIQHADLRFSLKVEGFLAETWEWEGEPYLRGLFAYARMPDELRASVGPPDPDREDYLVLLAAPLLPGPERVGPRPRPAEPVHPLPEPDRTAWLNDLGAGVDERYLRYLERGRIEGIPVVQCGEDRLLAILTVPTDEEATMGARRTLSQVRLYGPRGEVLFESRVYESGASALAGDADGDGSDEALVETWEWGVTYHTLSVDDGIRWESWEIGSDC